MQIYKVAGNLTADKDGYEYQYDYENRIVKITKDGSAIAEFAYDALGRRIEKRILLTPTIRGDIIITATGRFWRKRMQAAQTSACMYMAVTLMKCYI